MDDDYTRRRPSPDAIRDSVRAEDPSTWGARDLARHDSTRHESTSTTRSERRLDDATTFAEGYTPPTTPVGSTTSGPVATDPTPATYTGTPVTPIGTGVGVSHHDTTSGSGNSIRASDDRYTSDRVIEERGRVAHAEPPVERRRFSLGATFLGWAVAAFFTLVFSTIGLSLVGGSAFNDDGQLSFSDANGILIGSLVAYLIAAFLAYLIGGYAAGRIALWDGVKHGLGTVGWAILFALLAVIAGTYLADTLNVQNYLAGFDFGDLTGETVLAIVLSLAAMLGGAALGGKLGERYHDRVHGIDRRTHRAGRIRGRPL